MPGRRARQQPEQRLDQDVRLLVAERLVDARAVGDVREQDRALGSFHAA